MFTGFKLKTDEMFDDYKSVGEGIFKENERVVGEEINKFLLVDGSIDGTEMQKSWFPEVKADIFLSHSHKDRDKAIGLAGYLKRTFNLNVFIDSCVWGYANTLLKQIDEKYCKNSNSATYDYEKRNYSTSHVHTMLTTALVKMIHNTECLFFLNTPNSMETKDNIDNKTSSPWIYMEIAMSDMIEKIKPKRTGFIKKAFEEGMEYNAKDLNVKYNLETAHLTPMNQNDIANWVIGYHSKNQIASLLAEVHPLDVLYSQHNRIKIEEEVR